MDTRKRTIVKTLSWRTIGSLLTGAVAYLLTGQLLAAWGIVLFDNTVKLVLFYHHERFWLRIKFGQTAESPAYRNDYISQAKINLPCCQLISFLNALLFWKRGDEVPRPGSKQFDKLVDVSRCRNGPATALEDAAFLYNVGFNYGPSSLEFIQQEMDKGRPVSLSVDTEWWGVHDILVVDINRDLLTVVNYYKYEPAVLTCIRFSDLPLIPEEWNVTQARSYYQLAKG